jgi:hypothetical protein
VGKNGEVKEEIMANQVPNSFKGMLWKGQITGLTDVFKMILMQPGFVFNKDSHHAYADVSASEVATGAGYTAGGVTLTGVTITVDNAEDRAEVTWNNAQWTATGGTISTSGAILFDDSTATGSGDDYTDAIVSYKDAGGTIAATSGTPLIIASIMETVEDI